MIKGKVRSAQWMQLAKRNAVVGAVVLFVCVAVYLNWSYQQDDASAGKTLGEATLVGGGASDPLLGGSGQGGSKPGSGDSSGSTDASGALGPEDSSSYFANARLNRQQARDSALALLQEASASQDADQTMINQANASIQTMANLTVTEAQIENLVVAKGYKDCVSFMGEESISVVVDVPEGELTTADTARITEIVKDATGFTAGQITIIEVD